MMWGVELGRNKARLEPFPRNMKVAERIREAMFRQGVLVYLSTALAGKDGDAIVFGPPFIINSQEIDSAVGTLAVALEDVMASHT